MFPERDRQCHVMFHENSDDHTVYTSPLGYRPGKAFTGVMTLHDFLHDDLDVTDSKLLVIIKHIGPKKKGKSLPKVTLLPLTRNSHAQRQKHNTHCKCRNMR